MSTAVVLLALAVAPSSTPLSAPASATETSVGATVVTAPRPVWLVPSLHAAGVLVGMRVAVTALWPRFYDLSSLGRDGAQLRLAYTEPPDFRRDRPLLESDGDPWTINVLGHGLFGSEVYGRARQCGSGPLGALTLTAATTAAWEYGLEAINKRPSAVDLVVTPILGLALGEGRYQALRWLRRRPESRLRRVVSVVVDPLGSAERAWLGTRC
jgi:hypothetical protein